MNDIVYFVKESESNEELRYSLRSLKNFPRRKVWFYGGCYLSTDDRAFKDGIVGEQIREMFKVKCKYEK